jgi:hypothetical protein
MARRGAESSEEDRNTDAEATAAAGNVKIDLSEPDESPGEGGEDAEARVDSAERVRDPSTGKWASKKAERKEDHGKKKAWETEREDYDRRFKRQQEDFDRLRADSDRRLQELRQDMQRGTGQSADPYAAKLSDIEKQVEAELKLVNADENHSLARYNELRRQEYALVAQQTYAKLRQQEQATMQAVPRDQYAGRREIVNAEYPWLTDERYRPLADKAWVIRQGLINLDGRPDTIDTDREALATAVGRFGGEFGLRAPAPPSDRTRGLYGGPPFRTGPDRSPAPREIEVPRQLLNGTRLNEAVLRAALRDDAE